ncbi:hypothetical protein D3C75_1217600 [compost metagenome]
MRFALFEVLGDARKHGECLVAGQRGGAQGCRRGRRGRGIHRFTCFVEVGTRGLWLCFFRDGGV